MQWIDHFIDHWNPQVLQVLRISYMSGATSLKQTSPFSTVTPYSFSAARRRSCQPQARTQKHTNNMFNMSKIYKNTPKPKLLQSIATHNASHCQFINSSLHFRHKWQFNLWFNDIIKSLDSWSIFLLIAKHDKACLSPGAAGRTRALQVYPSLVTKEFKTFKGMSGINYAGIWVWYCKSTRECRESAAFIWLPNQRLMSLFELVYEGWKAIIAILLLYLLTSCHNWIQLLACDPEQVTSCALHSRYISKKQPQLWFWEDMEQFHDRSLSRFKIT